LRVSLSFFVYGLAYGPLLCACGAPPVAALSPRTEANLAGNRCQRGRCSCRALSADPDGQLETAAPAPGTRRFEWRLDAAPGVAWVVVDGKEQVFKDPQRPDGCFYLDLPPGDHRVRFRAAADDPNGTVGGGLSIYEYNPKGPWWYDVFHVRCGSPEACAPEYLAAWKRDVEKDHRELTDPCGGVKIRDLRWQSGRRSDGFHLSWFEVGFAMHVYQRPWDKPPRNADCPER
jgi:hypothetical protein